MEVTRRTPKLHNGSLPSQFLFGFMICSKQTVSSRPWNEYTWFTAHIMSVQDPSARMQPLLHHANQVVKTALHPISAAEHR